MGGGPDRSLASLNSCELGPLQPRPDNLEQGHKRWWNGMKRQLVKYLSVFEQPSSPPPLPRSSSRGLKTRRSSEGSAYETPAPEPKPSGHLPAGGLLIVTTPEGELKVTALGVFQQERALRKACEVLICTYDVLSAKRRTQQQLMAAALKQGPAKPGGSETPSTDSKKASSDDSLGTSYSTP